MVKPSLPPAGFILVPFQLKDNFPYLSQPWVILESLVSCKVVTAKIITLLLESWGNIGNYGRTATLVYYFVNSNIIEN